MQVSSSLHLAGGQKGGRVAANPFLRPYTETIGVIGLDRFLPSIYPHRFRRLGEDRRAVRNRRVPVFARQSDWGNQWVFFGRF